MSSLKKSLTIASLALLGVTGLAWADCEHGGQTYTDGQQVCVDGHLMKCSGTEWVDTGETCPAEGDDGSGGEDGDGGDTDGGDEGGGDDSGEEGGEDGDAGGGEGEG